MQIQSVRRVYMEIETKEVKTEPKWFTKWKRSTAKWIIKLTFRFLYFLVIILIIISLFTFFITYLSWEKIIRFFLDSGHAVTERFLAIFYNTTGGG